MKSRAPLDERSFEQLLAAAYLLQQQREPLPFPFAKQPLGPAMNEAERLAAIADAHAIVHGKQLRLQETLQLVAERTQRITGGTGAAIWLLRGSQAVCQLACGVSAANTGQSISAEASWLTACLRDGAVFRCADAKADPRMGYDTLPGVAQGSVVAVPIHYEGRVQGALEVTFAQAWGFEDADIRTCQILSGLVSETVAVAAGRERRDILESERATLLEALDRLQPHLSKLLNNANTPGQIQDRMGEMETPLPPALPPAPAGPTHGLARLGKYLLDQQEHGRPTSLELEPEAAPRSAPREVHTALNLSVAARQPDAGDGRANSSRPGIEHDFESHDFDSHQFEPVAQPISQHYGQATGPDQRESSLLVASDEPWLRAELETPAAEEPAAAVDFWRLHGADVCLAASALILAASLIWALWPQPKKTVASANASAAASTEPKLSAFEELLVAMGLAEAPPPPTTYAGAPGTRVWVDVNSALYYCPGAEPYGKTPKGKFLTQREAQDEQFQPARGQPCD